MSVPDAVTVLIPVWNGKEMLVRLLESLSRQTLRPEEVLVVDDGSTDGAPEEAERRGACVERLGGNYGFAQAVNHGLGLVQTPLVAIVNSDVDPAPDWLERLAPATAREEVWFVCGKLYHPGSEVLDGTFDLVSRGLGAWRAGNGRRDFPALNVARPVAMASMTATLYRRRIFDLVGLLEPAFESYLEDVDFALRACTQGYRGWYQPEAVAVHVGGGSLGRWHRDTVRRVARNQIFLLARHYPPSLIRRYWRSIGVTQILWGLVALKRGGLLPFLRGKWEGLARFREMRRPTDPSATERAVEECERELMFLQEAGGWDPFWRMYRVLAGRIK